MLLRSSRLSAGKSANALALDGEMEDADQGSSVPISAAAPPVAELGQPDGAALHTPIGGGPSSSARSRPKPVDHLLEGRDGHQPEPSLDIQMDEAAASEEKENEPVSDGLKTVGKSRVLVHAVEPPAKRVSAIRKLDTRLRFSFNNLEVVAACAAMGDGFETIEMETAELSLDLLWRPDGGVCVLRLDADFFGGVTHYTSLIADRLNAFSTWTLRVIRFQDIPPKLRKRFMPDNAALLICDDTALRTLRTQHSDEATSRGNVIPEIKKASVVWHVVSVPQSLACAVVDATIDCLRPGHLDWLAQKAETRVSDYEHYKWLLRTEVIKSRLRSLFDYSSARF